MRVTRACSIARDRMTFIRGSRWIVPSQEGLRARSLSLTRCAVIARKKVRSMSLPCTWGLSVRVHMSFSMSTVCVMQVLGAHQE